jgi:hypothetical protein
VGTCDRVNFKLFNCHRLRKLSSPHKLPHILRSMALRSRKMRIFVRQKIAAKEVLGKTSYLPQFFLAAALDRPVAKTRH